MHESILVSRRFRYLRIGARLTLLCVGAYAAHQPLTAPNGGTWLGYGLGTIGALLILWLMWFGVRKRRYNQGPGLLEDWLSAHVYLGLALIVVATLHTGFQFGWNVHTLAYGLMMAVILSGVFGVYAYMRFPAMMTENRRSLTLDQMLAQMSELDAECREVAMALGDQVNATVLDASENTRIGGGVLRQLSGREPDCATARALVKVRTLADQSDMSEAGPLRRLISLLPRTDDLLRRARRDVQLKALMDIWLYVHVPLSFALLAALLAHVISVFYYW
jgi:hypothetical protein